MNEQKIRTIEDIISAGRANLPNDEARNAELVADHVQHNIRPHGCVLDKNSRNHPEAAVWKTVIFIGGAQRVIARGTLYQCARVYDAALIRWASFRTRHHVDFSKPETFNFNKAQAGKDSIDADFVLHFGNLEECWERAGIVLQPPQPVSEDTAAESRTRADIAVLREELSEIKTMLHKVSETLHRWYSAPPAAPPAAPTETPTIFFAP